MAKIIYDENGLMVVKSDGCNFNPLPSENSGESSCYIPEWIKEEVKATWKAMQGVGQHEAYRIMEHMVRRIGYGEVDHPNGSNVDKDQ